MSCSHLCIPRTETVQPPYFQNRNIMFCLPIPTLIYLWEIFIFPVSVCLFCCSQICGPILGISLKDTWMWKLGLRPRNSQKRNTEMGFSLQCRALQQGICFTHKLHKTRQLWMHAFQNSWFWPRPKLCPQCTPALPPSKHIVFELSSPPNTFSTTPKTLGIRVNKKY